ncbi:hypothetical protein GOBAR_AA17836 [Gossypium barbadense]|uniref:RNase H type-1 domain-containing protein n=1 Tax=Gossypium barbadense TaxID=3634 RepID=A0A2P5XHK7_GOSBA|nr:hypothetical protein GOBAR_AA17836 [Gossypium barbadense]
MRARAIHDDIQFLEGSWWFYLAKCSPSRSKANALVIHWTPPPTGVAKEDEAGCGGMLRDGKKVARSFFFWSINAVGLEMAEVMAIKTALEHVKVPFIIESGSCVMLKEF